MKNFSIASLVLFLLSKKKSNSENIQNNVELNSVFENYYQDGLKINPINATNAICSYIIMSWAYAATCKNMIVLCACFINCSYNF